VAVLLLPCAGRDYICVQSMDGQLSFFEQDHASFTRQLDRCLVPGPMVYVSKTDSIVTGTCEMTVESYKYQVLAAASLAHPTERRDDDEAGPAAAKAPGRSLKVDWVANVGEHIHSMLVGRFSKSLKSSQVDILVVGTCAARGMNILPVLVSIATACAKRTGADVSPPGRSRRSDSRAASPVFSARAHSLLR
jgi:hypothetical protein